MLKEPRNGHGPHHHNGHTMALPSGPRCLGGAPVALHGPALLQGFVTHAQPLVSAWTRNQGSYGLPALTFAGDGRVPTDQCRRGGTFPDQPWKYRTFTATPTRA
ncbi:hypothetical protein GWK47_008288 [Chionoecetes opilio]|uniref:Uncharacterized protein n=1 Tax=Chionoecetes opilio TaxID=41210 RepID=A0A8J4XXQ3_CHIOP|nr:hypothetical protein GWK47_008288 [Chionoecetes opilio]